MRKILYVILVSRRSRGRIAKFPRSISSNEKNHGLRIEGILKLNLQANSSPHISPKIGKFNYLSASGDSAHSRASV